MESKQFAWLPIKMTSGKRIWLRTYYQHKSLYDESTGRPPLGSLYFIWSEAPEEKTWRLLKENVVHNRNVWNTPNLIKEDKL